MTESQKQFEEWAKKEDFDITYGSCSKNEYDSIFTQSAWKSWQASRSTLVVKLPVKFPENEDKDSAEVVYILDVLEQLALAGVRYE